MMADDIGKEEDANFLLCLTTAEKWGFNGDEAEDCENGNLGCPDCPFKDSISKLEEERLR